MTFLPIVGRELRVASRRRATYWIRSGMAVAVILFGTWFFLMVHDQPPQEIAQGLFGLLTGSGVIYCLFRGIGLTADSLSEEKREGTLGLLFLTDLKGYDVVFGKLVATSLNALYGVLAVVPVLAVPLLLGGLTPGECGRVGLVALDALFLSLAIGMVVSAMSRSGRKAKAAGVLIILVLTLGFPLWAAWPYFLGKASALNWVLMTPSIGFTYYSAWDKVYNVADAPFWWSLGVIHAFSWLSLILACLIAPRSWQDRPPGAQTLRWRDRWHLWSYGDIAERAIFRRHLLELNPFFWLAARARLRPAYVWGALALVACGWAWGIAKFQREWLNETMYILTAIVLNLLIKSWFATESGRQVAEDRKQGSLELLLTTPLSVRQILHGQTLALKRQFLGPVLLILAVEGLFLLSTSNDSPSERTDMVLFWLAIMVMLVADLIGLYWVGLWQALTAKSPNRAVSASLGRILALPWVVLAIVMLLLALSSISGGTDPDTSTLRLFILLWFGLGIGVDIGFGLLARQKLLASFRVAATQRFVKRRGFWKRVGLGKVEG